MGNENVIFSFDLLFLSIVFYDFTVKSDCWFVTNLYEMPKCINWVTLMWPWFKDIRVKCPWQSPQWQISLFCWFPKWLTTNLPGDLPRCIGHGELIVKSSNDGYLEDNRCFHFDVIQWFLTNQRSWGSHSGVK